MKQIFLSLAILLIVSAIFSIPSIALGATNISSTNRYAWSENAGWIDFGTSQGNVVASPDELTGYVWSENSGWISLNCSNTNSCITSNYKVSNNEYGNLSGYAYSENTGWINFRPQGTSGVTIDTDGNFIGYAWGENTGWIVFNCSTTNSCKTVNYKVSTTYNPNIRQTGYGGSSAPSLSQNPDIQTLPTLPPPTIPVQKTTPILVTQTPTQNPPTQIQDILNQITALKTKLQKQFTQTLKFGSRGSQVVLLQNKLKQFGFFPNNIASNGYFGKATQKAVQDFQIAKNIVGKNVAGYGIVGPVTRVALNGLAIK